MIVPDVNLLLYAELDAFPQHDAARRWWESTLSGERAVGLTSVAVFGFIRIATNRRVFTDPLPVDEALDRVGRWFEQPHVTLLSPGSRHLQIAFGLLATTGAAANLTTDVQIAAHAIEHDAEVHSNDRDFARFDGLRWLDPLTPAGP